MSKVFVGAYGRKELRIEPSCVAPNSAWLAIGQRDTTEEGAVGTQGGGLHLDHSATVRLYHAIGEILMGEATA